MDCGEQILTLSQQDIDDITNEFIVWSLPNGWETVLNPYQNGVDIKVKTTQNAQNTEILGCVNREGQSKTLNI